MTVMPGASRLLQPNTVRNLQSAAIPVSTAELSHAPYITTPDGVASIMLTLNLRKMEVRMDRNHAAGDPEGRQRRHSTPRPMGSKPGTPPARFSASI